MDVFEENPRLVNVTHFVEQRALEIAQLLSVVDNANLPKGEVAQGPRTFVQRLPRHMRRRAMSHNIKRMPRRVRIVAESTVMESKHRKKPPSRRRRRRPSNLLKTYIRRQRRIKWTETHIWHAKRFHIAETWGWRLAYRSCQRGYRAAFRDAVRHCVVQDTSFFATFELRGPSTILIRGLNTLCRPEVSKTFSNAGTCNGRAEGRAVLYEPNGYPLKCLGPVRFIFRYSDEENLGDSSTEKQLWISAHPALKNRLLQILCEIFDLQKKDAENSEMQSDIVKNKKENSEKSNKKLGDGQTKFRAEKIVSPPSFFAQKTGIILRILDENFARFRLIGPKSGMILSRILQEPKIEMLEPEMRNEKGNFYQWWREYYCENQSNFDTHSKQWHYWKSYFCNVEPGAVRSGTILALTIRDPRLFSDHKKRLPDDSLYENVVAPPSNLDASAVMSPIWSSEIRLETVDTKIPEAKLNEMRKEGKILTKVEENLIPVLLVQQPGASNGFGAGWDLVMPAGWAMPFWLALQYATARAVGLEFQRRSSMVFEDVFVGFPYLWPDTKAGREAAAEEARAATQTYYKRPSNRRVDYEKLKITHPFSRPYENLVNKWKTTSGDFDVGMEDFYVLRDRVALQRLRNEFASEKRAVAKRPRIDSNINQGVPLEMHGRALVAVRLISVGKGVPKQNAQMCMPTETDLQKIRSKTAFCEAEIIENKKTLPEKLSEEKRAETDEGEVDFIGFGGKKDVRYVETEIDPASLFDEQEKRKETRKLKEKEAKKRRRLRKTDPQISTKTDEEMEIFHLPENKFETCRRGTIGYVEDGGFSLAKGKGEAIGFCSLTALLECKKIQPVAVGKMPFYVLYRNVRSKYYRAAVLFIC